MGIFSSKIELDKKIKEQEEKINRLEEEVTSKVGIISSLKEQVAKLSEDNQIYVNKYIHTNFECEFCYATLQKDFRYCPNCGEKIVKQVEKSEGSKDNIFQIENDGNACLIVGYKGFKDKKIVIPSSIHGRPVIGIWNNVFQKCEYLEEVIFEEGCQYIGGSAFAECPNLKLVKLPKSLLEIGGAAFCMDSAIEEMIVPVNVKKIGSSAFSNCTSLRKVVLPDGLEIVESGLLSGTAIRELDIPETVLGIDAFAFARTNLSEVILPEQLRVLGNNAFDSCSRLKKIVIHSNVESIEKDVFTGCRPVIYCAGGSKAQMYARKYGFESEEIQPVTYKDQRRLGVKFIELSKCAKIQVNGRWINEEHYNLGHWITVIGGSKAEGYAYENISNYGVKHKICMHKYYTYDEAMRIQRELRTKGVDVSVFDYWGESEV